MYLQWLLIRKCLVSNSTYLKDETMSDKCSDFRSGIE